MVQDSAKIDALVRKAVFGSEDEKAHARWMIWEMRPFVTEMRWVLSWEAIAVGVGVWARAERESKPISKIAEPVNADRKFMTSRIE